MVIKAYEELENISKENFKHSPWYSISRDIKIELYDFVYNNFYPGLKIIVYPKEILGYIKETLGIEMSEPQICEMLQDCGVKYRDGYYTIKATSPYIVKKRRKFSAY